jgi:hypothetical protein
MTTGVEKDRQVAAPVQPVLVLLLHHGMQSLVVSHT